jgi:urease accessory protein
MQRDANLPELIQGLSASSLMRLMWLASPALPIGGFSYSEGLEAAVDRAGVTNETAAGDWLIDQLHLNLARADLPVLARAIAAWRANDLAMVESLDDWVLCTRESAEFTLQTEQMGRSLRDWATAQAGLGEVKYRCKTYPIAFALAASSIEASVHDCLVVFAFGWAENMVAAAVKSVPLGQSAGQRILARLVAEVPGVVVTALTMQDQQRQAFTPMLAILSAQHETQYSRLFRS